MWCPGKTLARACVLIIVLMASLTIFWGYQKRDKIQNTPGLAVKAFSDLENPIILGKVMKVIHSKKFRGISSWDALDVAHFNGISVKIHWTKEPYKWHVNDGEEVFAVLDGVIDMYYRELGEEKTAVLNPGDIFYAGVGCEHVAHPRSESRILVIEKEGSV